MPDAKIHGTSPDRKNRSKPKNTGNNAFANAANIVAAPISSSFRAIRNSLRHASIVPSGGKRRRTRQKKNCSKKRRTYRRK
jgi:hypothetical protein